MSRDRFYDDDEPIMEDNDEFVTVDEYRERLRHDPADARDWYRRKTRATRMNYD